jgi:hypothetical protein
MHRPEGQGTALAVDAESQCRADALLGGTAVDAKCLRRAESKLRGRFAAADAKGPCTGDADAALSTAHTCAAAFAGATSGDEGCAARKLRAMGTRTRGEARCARKAAAGSGGSPCLEQLASRFTTAIRKAERKGACTGTEAELTAVLETCDDPPPTEWTCSAADSPACNGTCPPGLACRPYEVFEDGTSVEAGCSCVDPVNGPACGEPVCSVDQTCPDPGFVCEQWRVGDARGCDHTVCQPAMVTPTTLPPGPENTARCDGGEFPSCGGTCPNGLRCQSVQALFQGFSFFAGCVCVDPAAPRCEAGPEECDIGWVQFSHCADPSLTCLVTLELDEGGTPDQLPTCSAAHCGPGLPTTTSTSATSTTNTTNTFATTVTIPGTITTSTSTPTTSTTTSTTVPCMSTPGVSGCFEDLGNCTIRDTCGGLEWEKKTTIPGPNHVDNLYVWAGCCEDGCQTLCQPNAAAEATCLAMAEAGTDGCTDQCPTGACYVERGGVAITTIFDWVNQLNAERFGGHDDWRLPTEAGFNPSGGRELESILQQPCTGMPCIDPIFGPTSAMGYWSRTGDASRSVDAWFVSFFDGSISNLIKREPRYVRAVRGGS